MEASIGRRGFRGMKTILHKLRYAALKPFWSSADCAILIGSVTVASHVGLVASLLFVWPITFSAAWFVFRASGRVELAERSRTVLDSWDSGYLAGRIGATHDVESAVCLSAVPNSTMVSVDEVTSRIEAFRAHLKKLQNAQRSSRD